MTQSNFLSSSFSNQYDTILFREFGGIDLLGGEWQKVSIARGLYKNYKMIFLNEPTASIDPNEETRLYNTFLKISENKTSIIVTHRLGLAKFADKILVLKNRKIQEFGQHEQLISDDNIYAKMFRLQSSAYE